MLRFPGKFDCTRIRPQSESRLLLGSRLFLQSLLLLPGRILPESRLFFESVILSVAKDPSTAQTSRADPSFSAANRFFPRLCLLRNWLICICLFCAAATAQPYPEVAWLAPSSYCNPYFGFRLTLPPELKSEPIFLPVEATNRRHMLLALRLWRLDRSADLFISAFEDGSENPAHLAAKVRMRMARDAGLLTTGPRELSVADHKFYRLSIFNDAPGPGNESSYFLAMRGSVLQIAIFSHADDLAASLKAALEHLEFLKPEQAACTSAPARAPDAIASGVTTNAAPPAPRPARLYYGPALPTALVESTLRASPGNSVPLGEFSRGTFADAALGVRAALPKGWQALPSDQADRVTELMRDPLDDPGAGDRRRALFRACSRVLFTAADPATEMITDVHPALAILAMPQGCIPDMVPPTTLEDRAATADFATVLVRSLGVPLLRRASPERRAGGSLSFNLEGTLPYQLPGEKLSRRLGLRVAATASGPWLILVYSVTPTPAFERELDAHIAIGLPAK